MKYNILIDVGGTGIKAGYCNMNGEISENFLEFPSNSDKTKEEIISHFCNICETVFSSINDKDKTIGSLCCAFPGPFDYEKGIPLLKGLSKYEAIYGVTLQNEMNSCFIRNSTGKLKNGFSSYHFINDVSAYALGVCQKYKLTEKTMYLCIGTGAGSAFTVKSKLCEDQTEGVPANGWIYPLKFKDSIIDDYISARGIEKLSFEHLGARFTPKELLEIENGNDIYKLFGIDFNQAVYPILQKFSANTLVLGGKISKAFDLFSYPIKDHTKKLGVNILLEPNTSKMTYLGLSQLISND